MGDDAAVLPIPASGHLLLTNDSLVWNRHFDFSTEPEDAGAKLLKRSVSDVGAMGGRPKHAVLSIACGGNVSMDWLKRFFEGLAEEARQCGCEINGGDLSSAELDHFVSSLTLVAVAERPIPRQGGKAGSRVWVTGSLGGSILGKHLHFTPRWNEGLWLSEQPEVLAAMDLTDGLVVDLPYMIPGKLQARLDLSFIPVSDAARASAQDSGKPAISHAFCDGEDYELAFITDPKTNPTAFESRWKKAFPGTPLTPIGTLDRAAGENAPHLPKVVGLDGTPIFPHEGFEHFD